MNTIHAIRYFHVPEQQMRERSTSECNCFMRCVCCTSLFSLFTCSTNRCFAFIFVPISVSDSQFTPSTLLAQWSKIAFYICQFLLDNWRKAPCTHTYLYFYIMQITKPKLKMKTAQVYMCLYVLDVRYINEAWRCFCFFSLILFAAKCRIALQDFHGSMIWSVRPLNETHMHWSFYLYASPSEIIMIEPWQ